MPRRAKIRDILSHLNYSIEQAAETTGVSQQTIRRWCQEGLPVMTAKRPHLIIGADLKEFIKERRRPKTGVTPVGHFRCMTCKAVGPPAIAVADYAALSDKHGMLHSLCGACEGATTRIISRADLTVWAETLEIAGCTGPPA